MATIYDLVTAENTVSYWKKLNENKQPYLGEVLFPIKKQLGTKLDWIKGSKNQPVGIRLSSFDAKAIRRDMQGVAEYSTKMPFFKESVYVDEDMRQNLNNFIDSNKQAIVDSILTNIFDRNVELIDACNITLERMRMEALTTGTITLSSNGQSYVYDYDMPADQKVTVTKSWSDKTADIIGDIQKYIDTMKAKGVTITRAVCNSSVVKDFVNNDAIKNAIYVFANGKVSVTKENALRYVSDELKISIAVYDNVYVDESKVAHKYVPDNTFVLIPDGILGNTCLGTTPEESDLTNNLNAQVSIVNKGIAVTKTDIVDPVNVETKVSMIGLPSFEQADSVMIVDTEVSGG